MATGEPADRHVTKIGGVPYRPADAPWPGSAIGEPMRFLGQINFCDSLDITGNLPGDVLLVFADAALDIVGFEWRPMGLGNLMLSSCVPKLPNDFEPCYGYICRTVSYPQAQPATRPPEQKYPKCLGRDVWSDRHLPQYQATQIGRAPQRIQAGDWNLPGKMLCTMSSVLPAEHKPYPWINHPEPLMPAHKWRRSDDKNELMLGDVGCVFISIDEDGELHWRWSCY